MSMFPERPSSALSSDLHALRLLGALEGLGYPAVIGSLDGQVLHETSALDELLKPDRDALYVKTRLQALIEQVGELLRGYGDGNPDLVQEVGTVKARYHLNGCLYGGDSGEAKMLIVVGVRKEEEEKLPSAKDLAGRFRLTKRQSQVALLLANRLSNAEVADRLTISPHTARRHTEAVLEKLDLQDRKEVRQVLLGA
jgi:DNA-binding CsgD family transcriptional regulator